MDRTRDIKLEGHKYAGLRAAQEKEEVARKVLEQEIIGKTGEITALKDELLSSKKQSENLVQSNLLEKAALEKIIEEKEDELVTLKQQVPERSFVKRKMCQEEPKDVSNKRSKLSDELMMMMNTEDNLDYLPSDIETGIEDDADVDSIDNSQANEDDLTEALDTNCVPESTATSMDDETSNAEIGEKEEILNDSSKALKQIEEFECFIKSKRMRDLTLSQTGTENHPIIGSSGEYQVSKTITVEKELDVLNDESNEYVNSKELHESVRVEGSDSSQPTTSQEGCGKEQTGIQDIELNLQPMAMVRPILVVKDIKTLIMPPCLDQDVIIPNHPSTSDLDVVMDISDTDTQELEVLKKQEEKIERELKLNVAGVVKNVLGKFYKQDNGIDSREEFEGMAADLTNKFKEDILANYRVSHGSCTTDRQHESYTGERIWGRWE